jgi:hypothetical protein
MYQKRKYLRSLRAGDVVEVYGRGVGWIVEAEAILDCDEYIWV